MKVVGANINDATYEKIRATAYEERISMSKWLARLIEKELNPAQKAVMREVEKKPMSYKSPPIKKSYIKDIGEDKKPEIRCEVCSKLNRSDVVCRFDGKKVSLTEDRSADAEQSCDKFERRAR
jgi:hypothetical protein